MQEFWKSLHERQGPPRRVSLLEYLVACVALVLLVLAGLAALFPFRLG